MKTFFLLATALLLLNPTFALADRDDDDDERKRRHQRSHHEVTWEGACKVERTWKKNGTYQEKRECKNAKRPVQVVVSQPPQVVYPPWFGERPSARKAPHPRKAQSSTPPVPVYRCDSATGTAILGGILGGVAGHQIGKGDGKTASTIGGAIAGVLIGGSLGRRIDPHNQACIGQALEAAPAGGRLEWVPAHDPRVKYSVTPGQAERRGELWCRTYIAAIVTHGRTERSRQVACRQANGTWMRHG